jgi:hypothetical protein
MSFFNGEIDLRAGNVYNNTIEVNNINEATGGNGVTIEGVLLSDDYVQIHDIAAPSNAANGQGRLYKLIGNSGLWWLPDSAGTPINLADASTSISRVGSTADNTLTRWDGTNADTIQGSGITVDDSNNITGVASIGLESGAFDTTLTVSTQTIGAPTVNIPDLTGTSGDILISNTAQNVMNKTVTNSTWSGGSVTGLTSFSVNDNGSNDLAIASSSSLTADRTLTVNVNDANRTLDMAGNVSFGGIVSMANNFTTIGANPLTFTTTGTTSLTLPTSGTLITTTAAQTLTNKTLTQPVITDASLSINDTATPNSLNLVSTSAPLLTADRTLTIDVSNADRTIDLAGNLSLSADLTTSGGNAITFTTTGPTSITLPTTGTMITAPVSLTTQVSGTLPVANGGTNSSTALTNGKIMVSSAGAIVEGASSSDPSFNSETLTASANQLVLGTTNTTTLNAIAPVASRIYTFQDAGGNANVALMSAPYVIGDLPYASSTTQLDRLAGVATGNSLISGGVGAAPIWGKIGLTTHVSGTLAIDNGGTGLTTTPLNGRLLIGNGTGYTLANLTAGAGVTINNSAGGIEIIANSTTAATEYDTPGSYTYAIPAGTKWLNVILQGAGSGGGGGSYFAGGNSGVSGAGGSAGMTRFLKIAVASNTTASIVVGAGSAGSAHGNASSSGTAAGGLSSITIGGRLITAAAGGGCDGATNTQSGSSGGSAGSQDGATATSGFNGLGGSATAAVGTSYYVNASGVAGIRGTTSSASAAGINGGNLLQGYYIVGGSGGSGSRGNNLVGAKGGDSMGGVYFGGSGGTQVATAAGSAGGGASGLAKGGDGAQASNDWTAEPGQRGSGGGSGTSGSLLESRSAGAKGGDGYVFIQPI